MKRNFTNENFEDFLRQSAEGLRMRPSDKVWKGISKNLNKRRRVIGLAIGSFLIAISALGYLLIQNSPNIPSLLNKPVAPASGTSASHQQTREMGRQANSTDIQKQGIASTSSPVRKNTGYSNDVLYTQQPAVSFNVNPAFPVQESNLTLDEFHPTIVDSYFEAEKETGSQENSHQQDEKISSFPLSIESVTNSFKPKTLKKLRWQFYFTPTISYRKLSENKSFLRSQSPTSPNYIPALVFDVNNVVTHKPDLGFELGTAVKYPVTRNMKLKAGLQFNVNRYDIKAYNSSTSVATIMFNGRTNNSRDSQNVYTQYSNTPTYRSNWLENYYIQISAPVGAEFKISGNEKTYFGLATTIQPTYVLGDRAYLISTNYKNYAEVPQLVRRWNVNTAIETFVGYSTGHLDWQVGPQVRYQLLSSFIDKYPVKENLFDFGLKIGISVNK